MSATVCQAIETCDAEIIHKSLVDACNNNVSDSAWRSQFLMNQEFISRPWPIFLNFKLSLGVYISY